MEEQLPRTTSTAPGHAGKRYSNEYYTTLFHTPNEQKPIKDSISSRQNLKFMPSQTNIPLPTKILRKGDCIPFENQNYRTNVKKINNPDQYKLWWAMLFFAFSLVFFALFLLEIKTEVSLLVSVFCFILFSYLFITVFLRPFLKKFKKSKKTNAPIQNNSTQMLKSIDSSQRPSEQFAVSDKIQSNPESPISNYMDRKFMRADRPFASLEEKVIVTSEDNNEQLANEALQKLNISHLEFTRYLSNLKSYISKNILAKIDVRSNDEAIKFMLNVPNLDHDTTANRVKELAASQFLAASKGSIDDNKIVFHILSVWLSYKMTPSADPAKDRLTQLSFSQKYVSFGKEPPIKKEGGICLYISKEWNEFYVIQRKQEKLHRYYSGSDSNNAMYGALVLFFYIIREDYDFLLDGADLQQPPFSMDAIFGPLKIV